MEWTPCGFAELAAGPTHLLDSRSSPVLKPRQLNSALLAVDKHLVPHETGPNALTSFALAVGDYTAQALVSSLLAAHFPSDAIIGEEDSADLQKPEQATVKSQIVRLAGEAMREALPLADEERAWDPVKAVERGDEDWMAAIDRGNSEGGPKGRHWALDPIDGTKGFLRGGQYAVCLGLIEDGEVVLGVMGCPNLAVDPKQPEGDKGALFVAVKGQGAFQVRSPRARVFSNRAGPRQDLSSAPSLVGRSSHGPSPDTLSPPNASSAPSPLPP